MSLDDRASNPDPANHMAEAGALRIGDVFPAARLLGRCVECRSLIFDRDPHESEPAAPAGCVCPTTTAPPSTAAPAPGCGRMLDSSEIDDRHRLALRIHGRGLWTAEVLATANGFTVLAGTIRVEVPARDDGINSEAWADRAAAHVLGELRRVL